MKLLTIAFVLALLTLSGTLAQHGQEFDAVEDWNAPSKEAIGAGGKNGSGEKGVASGRSLEAEISFEVPKFIHKVDNITVIDNDRDVIIIWKSVCTVE